MAPPSPPGELHQVRFEWNDTAVAEPPPANVVAWFLRQVEATPGKTALQGESTAWSYRELDRRSYRVAEELHHAGVCRGHRVGLFLERQPEALAAILGVLRVGAAYVPLETALPPARLRSMTEVAACRTILTTQRLSPALREARSTAVLLQLATGRADREPSRTPACDAEIEPGDPAYILFTSGSTGEPKGIVLGHLALANLIAWHLGCRSAVPTGQRLRGARTLQLASLAFDASFHEMFATWCSGGCLVMASGKERLDPAALVDLLERERVEKAILPVVLLHEVAEECLARRSLDLAIREVTTTGEQLHVTPAVVELFKRLPGLRLHNHYGPSETHVVTSLILPADPRRWPSHPAIGRPIGRTSVYLLDGASGTLSREGELMIGGVSLAQGYAASPALSAERFVPDPYAGTPGARLYRTGDRARYLDDGNVEFLGRLDDQLKVRGHRVEPAEVEAALDSHPAVRASAVTMRREQGDARLVAYLSLRDGGVDPAALRTHLGHRLPAYMLPGTFVAVDRFPRTPNGKLDRTALATLAGKELVAEPTEPPRTGVEKRLAGIWCEVLGRRRIGIRDDFFALGGDSLLAARTMTRLRREFGEGWTVGWLFEHPTIAQMAPVLTPGLARGEAQDAELRFPAAALGEGPLSFGQQRLWFLHQLCPGSAAYNLAFAWSLDGPLDVAAFRGALREVLRRHTVLRSTIIASGGEPRQIVARSVVPLPVVDLRRLAPGRREEEGRRRLATEAVRPFDLERGPLLRPMLLDLGRRRHFLALQMHHVVTDAWSQELLCHELEVGYRSALRGRALRLPDLPLQYAEFAAWQRRRLDSGALAEPLDWWRRTLTGLPPLVLPTDRRRLEIRGDRGAAVPVVIDAAATARLRQLASEAGASLFMTLVAAFMALLGRTAGQEDFAVGSPVADRPLPETEELIGFFVNTLVLRADLQGEPSYGELLRRVRRRSLDGFARQEVPFERIVEALGPERESGRSPLFQVLFAFENASADLALPGIVTRRLELGHRVAAQFDLVLFLRETGDSLAGSLEHSAELFDATSVRRLRGHFLNLLADVAADPGLAVSEAAWLGPAERHQLLVEWNETGASPAAAPVLFPALFAACADSRPDAAAVVDPATGAELSYRELDERSEALAGELRRQGVRAEVRVALLLDRSPEQVVALLAVLKSGGAYVALEPSAPSAWWRRIVEDAGVDLLVAHEHLLPDEPLAAKLLVLGRGGKLAGGTVPLGGTRGASRQRAPVRIDPRSAAYVIYTSGSTGRPKGVTVSHGSLAWLLSSCPEGRLVRPGERLLVLASIAFDLSVLEIHLSLVRGLTLVLGDVESIDASVLLERCRAGSIHALFLSTALWHELTRELVAHPERRPPSLRLVTLGTERLLPPQLAAWRRALGTDLRLVHLYGLTEGTAESTWHDLTAGDPVSERGDGEVPIGRPIPGVGLYVFDRRLRSVPIGTLGELWIAGEGLARGYHRRGRATAEHFVPHPLAREPGERLLRSGDLVRQRADGTLELVGRRDLQVKVRGQRLEPGEVEAELAAHPAVFDAAVALCDDSFRKGGTLSPSGDQGGKTLLVAWVAVDATAPDSAELRRHLRQRLPASRVPAHFVFLDALPRNRSGKVDRRRLPAPDGASRSSGTRGAAPRGRAQERIAAIWRDLLGLGEVGVDQSFFDLGGHSLLVVELRSRLRESCGESLSIVELFRHPTIAQLADHLGSGQPERIGPETFPLVPSGHATRRREAREELERQRESRRRYRSRTRGGG